MFKFLRLNRGQKFPTASDIADFAAIVNLCEKFRFQLFDDYRGGDLLSATKGSKTPFVQAIAELITGAGKYFWVIKTKGTGEFVGFVYLYNLVGSNKELFGAAIGTCIEKKFWGDSTLKLGQKFIKHCFLKLGIKKLKCETFRSNPYIATLLRNLGFDVEGVLKGETFVQDKLEDLVCWGLTRAQWLIDFACGGDVKNGQICTKKKEPKPLDYTSRSINNTKIIPIFRKHGK